MSATSPASSGPAGGHFEGQVGAYYLLSMLARAEPRGLPGTTIVRVEFQKAQEGFPLDDVIVHAQDEQGTAATLQIQLKRSIGFNPTDKIFKKVVGQIAEAIKEPVFWTSRNDLAIATARTSHKIDGAYQDVLKWAREIESPGIFFKRLALSGAANDDMRTFVNTLRAHLKEAGAPSDDETVKKILGRLQILVFDFTAVGSASEELARDRAKRVLPTDMAADAPKLWSTLIDVALEIASNGGDRNLERLIETLKNRGFRLVDDRRLANVREAIDEASRLALADIRDRVGKANLSRSERVAAVHDALDKARYVEIRGDAGVGKSGVLKHFAELLSAEARVVVLSPGRVIERGWIAMRGQLGFDGTARELLTDLATDGGATLFIDNLDSFSDTERTTVRDIVRAAAGVPGISIVATARRNFGVEEESWLPPEPLELLGRAPPIMIEELNASEVGELAEAEPRLAELMRDGHPARNIVRNLYRLARIASRPASEPTPTTELDMAEQWWNTADGRTDGNLDAGRRERARALRAIAERALAGDYLIDVKEQASPAIDELVRSETLFDRAKDIVVFRHDVLREWAIGNLLNAEPSAFTKLQLDRPTSAIMSRGVELAARFALEREVNGDRWAAMLASLTGSSIHRSWRRAVLLALIHSEAAATLLDRETDRLLANEASLLRELIRTMVAVDVEPASDLFVAAGADPASVPAGMFVPNGPSWSRVIIWLLKLGAKVPAQVLPDVVDLYSNWMFGMLGFDPLTPHLLTRIHAWLVELEGDDDFTEPGTPPRTYTGEFGYREADELIENLRTSFVLWCRRVPDLAAGYLKRTIARKHNEATVSSIFKFRGTLAQAAPKELAEMTAKALIAERQEPGLYHREERNQGPFQFIDHELFPPSPAQGPFFDLLTHAPSEGLALVRRLVAHAIEFYTEGRDPGDDGFQLTFADGERFFPWIRSFAWSRNEGPQNALASSLMALEAWAHKRLDAGESFGTVLADVLGPPGTPAAFLMVAVDIILSHWPNSREAAVPFAGCPELLCYDRERLAHDQIEYPDVLGLRALQGEPKIGPTTASLKERPSRRAILESTIGNYAIFGPPECRERLKVLLDAAVQRLGDYETGSDFGDPRFMARHALNRLDLANWLEQGAALEDGSTMKTYRYVSPEAEARHMEALAAAHATKATEANMRAALLLALDNPERSSPQMAEQAAVWAQDPARAAEAESAERLGSDAILSAALITVRDGTDELRSKYGAWAESVLINALASKDDAGQRMRSGLNFNPFATAFVGLFELYRRSRKPETLRLLLEIAARENPAGVAGFAVVVRQLAELDERLIKSILRCGLTASVKPSNRWGLSEEKRERDTNAYRTELASAVDAELAWLSDTRAEPPWREFAAAPVRRRRGIRIGGPPSAEPPEPKAASHETYVDEQAAAAWLHSLRPILDVTARPWLLDLVRVYSDFTSKRNGAGLAADEEVSGLERSDWNSAYYDLVARTLEALSQSEVEALGITPITVLPDESFFNVAPHLLRPVDVIFFDDHKLLVEAPRIRSAFAKRLTESRGWKRLAGDESMSIEVHIGPCIGSLFFNNYVFRKTTSYLTRSVIERIDPFLPTLSALVKSGPHFFVALVTLDLLEVTPRAALLPLGVEAAEAWLGSYPENTIFWISNGIGRRLCEWLRSLRSVAPDAFKADSPERARVDRILAALVQLGLPEARQLETALSKI